MSHRVLSAEAVEFRRVVIRALWTDGSFGYLNADEFLGGCPVCGSAVHVRFAGYAARASLKCHDGCDEEQIAIGVQKSQRAAR